MHIMDSATPHHQTITFVPPNYGLPNDLSKKNYVFVDEHNRHKRLKVMRACEGCRKRKIKCDGATSNEWPCAACVKLKLHCAPPQMRYDTNATFNGHSSNPSVGGFEKVLDFDSGTDTESGDESYVYSSPHHMPSLHGPRSVHQGPYRPHIPQQRLSFSGSDLRSFTPTSLDDNIPLRRPAFLPNVTSAPSVDTFSQMSSSYHSNADQPTTPSAMGVPVTRSNSWPSASTDVPDLSDYLGQLKIDVSGGAPYIMHQKKTLAEAPALEEFEVTLPAVPVTIGSVLKIPPELMPNDEQAMRYFDIFFKEIYPYVPVISKTYFFSQWQNNRASLSPLLLEGIFACACIMNGEQMQAAKWLALASKHETYFMDVPRLSTMQALVILLKAREATPKRGYYYRSWMAVRTLCDMGKDLELDQHINQHKPDSVCTFEHTDCLVKTRLWQMIFILEVMVGGPQGRFNFGVDLDSVDTVLPIGDLSSLDEESAASRRLAYFVGVIRPVRLAGTVYVQIKDLPNWQSHPSMVALNPLLPRWREDLPPDMQLTFAEDGSPPWLPSHFVANMHCYHYLSVIMTRRPQLTASDVFEREGEWRDHMVVCYDAAKKLCRLQEALNQQYGINSYVAMLRGINFTIYCILTCSMLHLVALTCPDPEFNQEAKEYFERHMRVLEICMSAWPAPDLRAQVQSLREAFSKDLSKPFEIKPSILAGMSVGVGTPGAVALSESMGNVHPGLVGHQMPRKQSPPRSIPRSSPNNNSPSPLQMRTPVPGDDRGANAFSMNANPPQGQYISDQQIGENGMHIQTKWNPAPIIHQWMHAFNPPTSGSSVSSSSDHPAANAAQDLPTPTGPAPNMNYGPPPTNTMPINMPGQMGMRMPLNQSLDPNSQLSASPHFSMDSQLSQQSHASMHGYMSQVPMQQGMYASSPTEINAPSLISPTHSSHPNQPGYPMPNNVQYFPQQPPPQQTYTSPPNMHAHQGLQPQRPNMQQFVSPSMWQHALANSYPVSTGVKRERDEDPEMLYVQ